MWYLSKLFTILLLQIECSKRFIIKIAVGACDLCANALKDARVEFMQRISVLSFTKLREYCASVNNAEHA